MTCGKKEPKLERIFEREYGKEKGDRIFFGYENKKRKKKK